MGEFDKDEIFYTVAVLSKYYKPEVAEYLKALVNLEISVFSNEDFNDVFGRLDSYIKIAYYNIIFRSIELIKKIDTVTFNKDRLYISSTFGDINVFYQDNNSDTFSLLATNYRFDKELSEKPMVRVHQINTIQPGNKTNSLRTLTSLRKELTNEVTRVLLEDWDIDIQDSDKKLFSRDYQKELSWINVYKSIQ